MTRTTAYGIRVSGGWWSGQQTESSKIEMRFSYDIVDATLMRDRDVAEEVAQRLGGATVKRVDLIEE